MTPVRHGGDQSLALAGLHLADLALMQHQPADDLHIEGAQAQRPPGRFAHSGEGFGQKLVDGLARRQPVAEFLGAGADLLIAQRLDFRLKRIDRFHGTLGCLDLAVIGCAEDHFGQVAESQHQTCSPLRARRTARTILCPASTGISGETE
jgi:hypothetical protein